ncbi:unnamed protein product [Eruca vesicaria subsp. sativa]|uniref:Uncharacterized protein n=1 Tax=Eruca vesicaria subsp. sativa TaxID=29727 RepID=A0ABC8L6B6_ERUVS|nr:unnamed protein product [Eruca vesicaria subsp. sativa]
MATKKPTKMDAYEYIDTVRDRFEDNREIYDTFLKVLKDFHHDRIGPNDVKSKVIELFKGHQNLLLGFNKFIGRNQTRPRKSEFPVALAFVRKVKVTTVTHGKVTR